MPTQYWQAEPSFVCAQWNSGTNLATWEGSPLLKSSLYFRNVALSENPDGSLHVDAQNGGDAWDVPSGYWIVSNAFYGEFPGYFTDDNQTGVQIQLGLWMPDEQFSVQFSVEPPATPSS